jgi:hypothetical protein
MKLSRSEFKKIIKECLVEIFAESAGATQPVRPQPQRPLRTESPRARTDETPPVINEAIREVAKNDDVLASILADTAKTTLRTQLDAEVNPAKMLSEVMGQSGGVVLPTSNLGDSEEVSSVWTDLAFSNVKRKQK